MDIIRQKINMRDERFDSLKFVLIILVCWGHLIQIDKNAFSGETIALYKLIYTFHVPLFAFVSGFFTNSNKDYSMFDENTEAIDTFSEKVKIELSDIYI